MCRTSPPAETGRAHSTKNWSVGRDAFHSVHILSVRSLRRGGTRPCHLPDASIAIGATIAVSITINSPSPSTPTKYWTPSDGIQSCCSTNCSVPFVASKDFHSSNASPSVSETETQRHPARATLALAARHHETADERQQGQDGENGQPVHLLASPHQDQHQHHQRDAEDAQITLHLTILQTRHNSAAP